MSTADPMRISGFTFVRNAVRLDFPVVECIRSVLPMVDEFVVAVGESDDDTEELIRSIGDPKIVIVPTRWNPNLRSGGYVLAQQTNIALFNCTGHWAVYIQADEAIHEDDHAALRSLMEKYRDDDSVEALSLRRLNFVGDYRTYFAVPEDIIVRVVKPHRFALSRGDAAGFTVHRKYKERGHRIRAVDTDIPIFHYMSIRGSATQTEKNRVAAELGYGRDGGQDDNSYKDLPRKFLASYEQAHPAPMTPRVARHDFRLDLDSSSMRRKLTARERKTLIKHFLARHVSRIFRVGAGSSRLVATERPREKEK